MNKNEEKKHIDQTVHTPVLLNEVIENLNLGKGDVVFDGTFGGGGYSKEICKKIEDGVLVATDLDGAAIERGAENISEFITTKHLVKKNFSEIKTILSDLNIELLDSATLDLGFSSDQLDKSERGFSFKNLDEDILLTLKDNPTEDDVTAIDILNDWEEENIADIIYGFGGEQFSRRIAAGISVFRKEQEIKTVGDLVGIVNDTVPNFYKQRRTHPATKTFQALRIAVNSELEVIKKTLPDIVDCLKEGGRLCVVTFHSLEDRVVKNVFRELKNEGRVKLTYKKPIDPTDQEVKENPRSRSAKLRVVEKI